MPSLTPLTKEKSICLMAGLYGAEQNPGKWIKTLTSSPQTKKTQIILFSDNKQNRNGTTLAKYITDQKLGNVKETPPKRSRTTNNIIIAWMWHIDKEALEKWDKENKDTEKENLWFTS